MLRVGDERLVAMLGGAIDRIEPVGGGFTHTHLSRVFMVDGRTAIAKAATDQRTAEDVRYEHGVLSRYALDFMPRVVAFADGELPLLVIEDLSDARWPPPWPAVEPFFTIVDQLGEVDADADVLPLRDDKLPTWEQVLAKHEAVERMGGVPSGWLEMAAPVLAASAARATVEGTKLLHADIWHSNVCFAERVSC